MIDNNEQTPNVEPENKITCEPPPIKSKPFSDPEVPASICRQLSYTPLFNQEADQQENNTNQNEIDSIECEIPIPGSPSFG